MRLHAKAPTAGSTQRQASGLGRFFRGAFAIRGASSDAGGSSASSHARGCSSATSRSLLALASLSALSLASLLFAPAPALAGTASGRPFLFSFNGSDTNAGRFIQPDNIAIDNSSGFVYVADEENSTGGQFDVSKFNPNGTAADYAATGSSSLLSAPGLEFHSNLGVAVDNSGGPNQGRIYVTQGFEDRLNSFDPSGTHICTVKLPFRPADVAVGPTGHPWIAPDLNGDGVLTQYESSGCPLAPLSTIPAEEVGEVDIDASDNVYLRFGATNSSGDLDKYVGGVFDSSLGTGFKDVYVDQSSPGGHIFASRENDFAEFEPDGTEVATFGTEAEGGYVLVGDGVGYNPSLDWVYVASRFSGAIAVFGPPASGTVPDVTAIAAPSGVGISSAHLEGTVNPQGVNNSWQFEWKNPFQSWAAAGSSPPQSLPVDSSDHTVELDTDALRGNTTYQVRLVGINADNDLRAFSGEVKEFTTAPAAAAPAVTIDPPSAITATKATVSGTIDPEGDTADWRVQVQKNCSGDFVSQVPKEIAEGSETPVAVSYELEGLLHAARYCVRIDASNSFGTTTSETKEFSTDPIPPSEAEAAFAAPRTDTTARINARVNPEGDVALAGVLTYRFELSTDGLSWTPQPIRESTIGSRSKIVVAEELTGLQPDTTYHYRLALAENDAGPAASLGDAKTFTTRPTPVEPLCPNAEIRAKQHSTYLPDCRAFELVNNPDKGNQDAFPPSRNRIPVITPDGEAALWSVAGGAPGANVTSLNDFLATRTASGWRSGALAPPPSEQIKEQYIAEMATPDLTRFVAAAFNSDESTSLVRLDRDQNQELLEAYPGRARSTNAQMTNDGAHVFNEEDGQVIDIGDGEPAELISIQPDGEPSECNADMSVASGIKYNPAALAYRWIDMIDGSRVYFRAKPNGFCGARIGLYVRDLDAQQTTEIDPGSAHDVQFIRAAPDGRSAYFSTHSQLDPDDQNPDGDVYRWDEAEGASTCLTCEADPDVSLDTDNSELAPVMVSDDLSHVYFNSEQRLTPEATPGHRTIYALSDGEIRFVADANTQSALAQGDAELSADGNVLVFIASASMGLTADVVEPAGSNQVYRYDDRDGSLECISCRRGGPTTHAAALRERFGFALAPRISADGAVATFTTKEALVPRDVNQQIDIYQWREGSLGLITDGVSSYKRPPEVLGVDADGSDIHFIAVSPGLTGFEEDGVANLYDARVEGGFDPPAPPAHCREDSCQGPLQAPPGLAGASSAAFSGGGNLAPARRGRCRRGTVRRGGRCVSKRALSRRSCRKKSGEAKRRCMSRLRRIDREARAQRETRRAK